MWQTEGTMCFLVNLRIKVSRLSTPDDFEFFKSLIILSTSSGDTAEREKDTFLSAMIFLTLAKEFIFTSMYMVKPLKSDQASIFPRPTFSS